MDFVSALLYTATASSSSGFFTKDCGLPVGIDSLAPQVPFINLPHLLSVRFLETQSDLQGLCSCMRRSYVI